MKPLIKSRYYCYLLIFFFFNVLRGTGQEVLSWERGSLSACPGSGVTTPYALEKTPLCSVPEAKVFIFKAGTVRQP